MKFVFLAFLKISSAKFRSRGVDLLLGGRSEQFEKSSIPRKDYRRDDSIAEEPTAGSFAKTFEVLGLKCRSRPLLSLFGKFVSSFNFGVALSGHAELEAFEFKIGGSTRIYINGTLHSGGS